MVKKTNLNILTDIEENKKAKFMCSKCNRKFSSGSCFINHITSKKICNGIIDNLTYVMRQIPRCVSGYKTILAICDSEDVDEIEKLRLENQLRQKLMKVLLTLRNLEYDPVTSGINDTLIKKLFKMYDNLLTSNYDDDNIDGIDIKRSYSAMFDKPLLPIKLDM